MYDGEDFTRALHELDSLKDRVAGKLAQRHPTAELHDAGTTIITHFGLPPDLAGGFASAYSRDLHALVTEAGGDHFDVVRTAILDGMMMGVALGRLAPDDHHPGLEGE